MQKTVAHVETTFIIEGQSLTLETRNTVRVEAKSMEKLRAFLASPLIGDAKIAKLLEAATQYTEKFTEDNTTQTHCIKMDGEVIARISDADEGNDEPSTAKEATND